MPSFLLLHVFLRLQIGHVPNPQQKYEKCTYKVHYLAIGWAVLHEISYFSTLQWAQTEFTLKSYIPESSKTGCSPLISVIYNRKVHFRIFIRIRYSKYDLDFL